MRRLVLILFTACLTFEACAQTPAPQATVFVASTPCSKGLKPLPEMSPATDCEFAKWHLILYRNASGEPANYKLSCEYGMTRPNTTLVGNQKQTLNLEGKWSIRKGTKANADAIVYQIAKCNCANNSG